MDDKKTNAFVSTFNPYRKKFTMKYQSPLFGEMVWTTREGFLSSDNIRRAIIEQLTVGFFVTHTPNVVGIDIDDHNNLGEGYLLNVYNQVVRRMITNL